MVTAALPSIGETFFANTAALKQAQLDWLAHQHGVPILALAQDGDGAGWVLGTARVERVGKRFEFLEDGAGAFVVVARDEDGIGRDLVAWEPREGWIAPWLEALDLLGQHEVLAPRMGEPLKVHRDVLSWLQGGRNGVVILNRNGARQLLEGMTVEADDVEHGRALKRVLDPPPPKIMVRETAGRAAA